MDTPPESPGAVSAPSMTLADRLMPRASVRVQLVLAASMWFVASLILGVRGALWLGRSPMWLPLLVLGVGIGIIKARFLLDAVARRAAARIHARGRSACAGGFLSASSWLMVVGMIAAGHALRLTAIPRPVLGILYVAVGIGLVISDRIYWREAIQATR